MGIPGENRRWPSCPTALWPCSRCTKRGLVGPVVGGTCLLSAYSPQPSFPVGPIARGQLLTSRKHLRGGGAGDRLNTRICTWALGPSVDRNLDGGTWNPPPWCYLVQLLLLAVSWANFSSSLGIWLSSSVTGHACVWWLTVNDAKVIDHNKAST